MGVCRGSWMGCGAAVLLVVWGCLVRLAVAAGGASVPYGFVDTQVAAGFQLPTDFAFFPGGDESKFLVLEKAGFVRYVEDGVKQGVPVLDLTDLINNYLDRTLLSIAIDNNFNNGEPYIYLAYALETGGAARGPKTGQIARYELEPSGKRGVPGSKQVLLGTVTGAGCAGEDLSQDILCCDSTTHCVGGIEQTEDGILWVTIGDGAIPQVTTDGYALRAQDPDSLNGKVLRIKRDGTGAEDNPMYSDDGTSNRSKIFGYGLRNGWRIHYDPPTGGALISDVGWGRFESIKLALPNQNFGWPCLEGKQVTAGFSGYPECGTGYPQVGEAREPVEVYNRRIGIAVSSAIRVPFSSWPSEYRDMIFYTDYGLNVMRYFGLSSSGVRTPGAAKEFASGLAGPVQLRLGSDDKLYYLSISAQELRVISYEPDGRPPRIETLSPPDNASGIELTTHVEVGLSKLVTEDSLSDAITLTAVSTDTRIAGKVEQIIESRTIRFRPNRELDPSTEFRLSIGNVRDPEGQLLSNPSVTTFTTGTGRTRFVSDLPFVSEKNFLGPVERDQSNGGGGSSDGVPIEIRGVKFDKGLGGIPLMEVTVDLPAECVRFQATVGVDDSSLDLDFSRAHFEVLKGNEKVYDSQDELGGPVMRTSRAVDIDVDVDGASTITLRAENGGTTRNEANLVAWGDARLRCGGFDRVKPKVTEILPAEDGTRVGINTEIVIRFSKPMDSRFFPNAVRLRSGGQEVGWTPQVNSETTQLTMILGELTHDTKYVIIISTDARDRVGNRMARTIRSRFQTKLAPATGSTISLLELVPTQRWEGSVALQQEPVDIVDPSTQVFPSGIGMQPWSRVEFAVPEDCSVVEGLAGLDGVSNPLARCRMFIVGQTTGNFLFDETFRLEDGGVEINVDVSGEERIRFYTKTPDRSITDTYCNWADIKFICSSGDRPVTAEAPLLQSKRKVRIDENAIGGSITFATGTDASTLTFAKGIVATPNISLLYSIPWRCSKLSATYGLHPQATSEASLSFAINGNGLTKCETERFFPGTKPRFMECRLRRTARRFNLQVLSGGDNNTGDVGVIGDPQLDCVVGSRKPVAFINPLPENFVMNDEINFSGYGTEFSGGELSDASLSWSVVQHHCAPVCHTHPIFEESGVKNGMFTVDPHGDYFYYEIKLRVCNPPLGPTETETGDRCSSTSASLYPLTADLTVDTEPSGLIAGIDSINGQGPLLQTVVVGAIVELSTVRVQESHTFREWSHDGATSPTTTVLIENTDSRTFIARFDS